MIKVTGYCFSRSSTSLEKVSRFVFCKTVWLCNNEREIDLCTLLSWGTLAEVLIYVENFRYVYFSVSIRFWLFFVLGKPGLNFRSFCQKVMKIEGFLELDVWSLEKSIFAILRMKRKKVCDLNPKFNLYRIQRTGRKTHRHLTSSILSQVLKGTVHSLGTCPDIVPQMRRNSKVFGKYSILG